MFNIIALNACSFSWLKPTDVRGETWKCLFTTFSQPNWQSFRGSAGKNITKSWENTTTSKCTLFHFFFFNKCTNEKCNFYFVIVGLFFWTVIFLIFLVFLRPSYNSCYQCASRWKHIQDNGARGLQMNCQDELSSLDEKQESTLSTW